MKSPFKGTSARYSDILLKVSEMKGAEGMAVNKTEKVPALVGRLY